MATIKEMIENAGTVRVLVGGGLTFENIERIMAETGASEFHFGTAIRDNCSVFGEINEKKLASLVKILRQR